MECIGCHVTASQWHAAASSCSDESLLQKCSPADVHVGEFRKISLTLKYLKHQLVHYMLVLSGPAAHPESTLHLSCIENTTDNHVLANLRILGCFLVHAVKTPRQVEAVWGTFISSNTRHVPCLFPIQNVNDICFQILFLFSLFCAPEPNSLTVCLQQNGVQTIC